jgi:hypothetical protein
MTHSIGDQFYRYLDTNHGIILDNYTVVGVTTCGVWLDVFGVRKFVLLSASKRYAAPTIEEAQVSFCFRKRRQIKLLTAQLTRATNALAAAQRGEWGSKSKFVFQDKWPF